MTQYKSIGDDGKNNVWIRDGVLYVKVTDMQYGMLVQGGYADRVYKMPYNDTLEDARETNDIGISDIDRCVEYGDVIRQGRLIQ